MNDFNKKRPGGPDRYSSDLHREKLPIGLCISNDRTTPVPTVAVDWTEPRAERRYGAPDRRKSAKSPSRAVPTVTNESIGKVIETALRDRDTFPRGENTTNPVERSDYDTLMLTLNNVGRGVQMIDHTGRVLVCNDQAAEMLGVSQEFLAAKPLFVEVVEEQYRRQEFAACPPEIKAELIRQFLSRQPELYQRRRPDGRVVEVCSVPLADGGVVRTHTDITERWQAEQRVKYMAHHDFLTGLANRARFQEEVTIAIENGDGFAVLLIDVDYFKRVNDTHGHHFGDALLKDVADRIQTNARSTDLAARLGGDEFALLVRGVPDATIGERVATAIIAGMERPFGSLGKVLIPSVSVGVVTITSETMDLAERQQVVWRADLALYSAKSAGRGCWRTFLPEMAQRELQEKALLLEIRTAIAEEQFEVYYQPIVEIASNRISGFEALVRWHHPTRGLLAAGEFIPVLESTGLITQVGQWVLERACRDAMQWAEHIRIFVNLSPRQLSNSSLLSAVTEILRRSGLPPERLELEITETSMMQTSVHAENTISAFRNMGIRIALDDFGTGYSSLSHISTLHFDTIKIDRSFVTDAAESVASAAVVRAVTSIARELSIGTVAEGVETLEQLAWIRSVGCREAQGYLFSKPVALAAATAMIGN